MLHTLALGGWMAAAAAALIELISWRSHAARMEAVARVCHELRGPITAARLGLQLGARVGELSPARLRAVELELERAALALDDLAEARQRRRRRRAVGGQLVDIQQLLADSAEAWRASAQSRGVELCLRWSGDAVRVRGDRLRLAQATGNLIANAIEHGGGVVEVRGRSLQAAVRIEVVDSGPGLPAPVADLTRRAHGGRGARGRGLAIAATIAADHGGRLAAAPAERGARLTLELPRVPPEGRPQPVSSHTRRRGG